VAGETAANRTGSSKPRQTESSQFLLDHETPSFAKASAGTHKTHETQAAAHEESVECFFGHTPGGACEQAAYPTPTLNRTDCRWRARRAMLTGEGTGGVR
jgi:hypothetical protein